jgi:glyoxylase-like metal-dependent hydrolase (beta-lactamase superfamily II)
MHAMSTLKLSCALAAVLGASALTSSQGVTVIPGAFEPGRQPDGNSVVFEAPDGLIVLDTGRHAEHTQKILDFAAQKKQRIVAVVNSHWHLDHTSGNARIRAAYPNVKVYASNAIEAAMAGFLANSKQQAAAYLEQPDVPEAVKVDIRGDIATIDSGKALFPDVVLGQEGDHELGGRNLHLGVEHAATRGDVWIFDAKARYLAGGDLVTLPVPFFDTGCAPKWSAALAKLDKLRFDTFVPGHGPVMDHAQFSLYRKSFDAFAACAASGADKKACAEGWVRDAGPLMAEADRSRVGGMLEYYVDLLRNPAKRAELCD